MSDPDPIDTLTRRLRFQPKMGGNREAITVPCSLLQRLLGLAQVAEYAANNSIDKEALAREMEWLRMEIGDGQGFAIAITISPSDTPKKGPSQ